MRKGRKFSVADVDPADRQEMVRAFQIIDQELDEVFQMVNSIDFRVVSAGGKPNNLDARYLIYTSNAAANTDDTLNHQLGRTPTGVIQVEVPVLVGGSPNSGMVYFGSVAPTTTTVTLRCTTASKRCCVLLI